MPLVRFALLVPVLVSTGLAAQIPDEFTNLRVLPPEVSRESLLTVMRGFSFALGVRCQYCHVGGDGVSFEGVEFDRDDDPDKRKARIMLRMVRQLNDGILAQLPDRTNPPVAVECKTCHRGLPRPMLLKHELRAALDSGGPDSAAARYRELRATSLTAGMYDFTEWEVNTLGEELAREGRPRDAVSIYQLNETEFPESISIKLAVADLLEELGDTPNAIQYYERVLELRPAQRTATARLAALRGREGGA